MHWWVWMSDRSEIAADTPAKEKTTTLGQGLKLAVEMGPIAIFMISYNIAHRTMPDQAIFIATAIFMVATVLSIGVAWAKERRIPPMLAVTLVIVVVFGGLTLYLRDPIFIKIKPTIINCLWAFAIFGGLAVGRNIWKLLFGVAFTLTDESWKALAVRWGLFFLFLAGLNEFIWRTFSEAFWANFKFWGVLPITVLFALLQLPLLMKDPLYRASLEEGDTPSAK
jgi:intracellular septation protein